MEARNKFAKGGRLTSADTRRSIRARLAVGVYSKSQAMDGIHAMYARARLDGLTA